MTYEKIVFQEIKSVEEELKELGDAVLKRAMEVCGCRLVRKGMRNGSEWWNDKVKSTVLQKRKVFE